MNAQDPPDADAGSLLGRAAGGDADAWGALLAGHQERLQRVAAFRLDPRLRGRVDAADVVQEAFAAATARRPAGEAAVWEGRRAKPSAHEADVDLNPRIGFDYMLPGTQRTVPTPGRNVKRYFAAAMDAETDRVVWVRGERKTSRLFIDLLRKLLAEYPDRAVVHVVLDNYTIHSSRQTRLWLAERGAKFRLHFLPPYCPDDNRIERKLWREMHANVTVNHRCGTIEELVDEVVHYLMKHNRTAKVKVRESRAAI